MCKSRLLAVALAALLLAAASPADAGDAVEGVWLTEKKKVAVRLHRCGEALCGRIVWLAKPRDRGGALKRDAANPDPALTSRP